MAINNLYSAPTSSPVNTLFYKFIAASANTVYSTSSLSLSPGIYTVTCVNTTNATVTFWGGTSVLTTVTTASGTITANLAAECTKITYFTSTGSSIEVSVQRTGNALTYSASGTLETLTNTQTYAGTGYAYVVAVGAGGGGSPAGGNANTGGGSGGVYGFQTYLNGSTSVTIGTGGTHVNNNGIANTGGSTVFGNVTVNGGTGGKVYGFRNTDSQGGTPGGGAGGGQAGNGVASSPSPYNFLVAGTTGGGAGSNNSFNDRQMGAGSGIGTGGNGGAGSNAPTNANGYGAGGGAGGYSNNGTDGTSGVVYVLKEIS